MNPYLCVQEICYAVAGRTILDRVSFDVDGAETMVLLGRSGSGKTTLLRLINGLLQPASGAISIAGEDTRVRDPIAVRRGIGYVIQEFGLLPHWTVEENASLVLRLNGVPQTERRKRAWEVLRDVGLEPEEFASRLPGELSGGQRQRVGVARAIAANPKLLLFDEPFGALDPVTRHEMQQLFLSIKARYQAAAVFVTHDLLEALAIGTRIAVLDCGRLEGIFTADEFLKAQTPEASRFLATLQPLSKVSKPSHFAHG